MDHSALHLVFWGFAFSFSSDRKEGMDGLVSCTLAFRLEIGRIGKDGTNGWTNRMDVWLDG